MRKLLNWRQQCDAVKEGNETHSVLTTFTKSTAKRNGRLFTLKTIFKRNKGDGEKPRKDLIKASQIIEYFKYFFEYTKQDEFPAEAAADANEILTRYLDSYDHSDDQSGWFEKIRGITADLGYAVKPKDFKKHPEDYKGHVGHVSTVIRIALTGRAQSPDIWEIQQIMGEELTRERIKAQIK